MPDWLGEAIIGAVFTVLGFSGKVLFDFLRARRAETQLQRSEPVKQLVSKDFVDAVPGVGAETFFDASSSLVSMVGFVEGAGLAVKAP